MAAEPNTLLVGIDLGTARTAMMSNRRHQEIMESVVGYPRDIIGVKILNRTQVIGREAISRRAYLDVYSPLVDGVLKEASEKDLEAARELIKHAVSLADPKPGDRVCGIIGVPARASVANKGQILKICENLMDVSKVVSEPFMVAYGRGMLENSIIVNIGAGTIDLCAMRGTVPTPENQISLLKGGNHIDELLEIAIRDAYTGVQIDRTTARTIKDRYAFVGQAAEPIIHPMRINGKPADLDLTEPIRITCETIVVDIADNIKKLLLSFDPEHQDAVLTNIVLSGGGSRIQGLTAMIERHLSDYGHVSVGMVADADYSGAQGALKLAVELPPEYWNQVGDMIGA